MFSQCLLFAGSGENTGLEQIWLVSFVQWSIVRLTFGTTNSKKVTH
jgi:hypothetical protein